MIPLNDAPNFRDTCLSSLYSGCKNTVIDAVCRAWRGHKKFRSDVGCNTHANYGPYETPLTSIILAGCGKEYGGGEEASNMVGYCKDETRFLYKTECNTLRKLLPGAHTDQ